MATFKKTRRGKNSTLRALEKRKQRIQEVHLKHFENQVGIELFYNENRKMTFGVPVENLKDAVQLIKNSEKLISPFDYADKLNASRLEDGISTQNDYKIGYHILAAAIVEKQQDVSEDPYNMSWIIWITDTGEKQKVDLAGMHHGEWLTLTNNNIIG